MIGSSVASVPANSSVTRPWRETSIRFERCRISGRYKEITHNRKPFVGDAVDELVDFGDSADIDAAGRFVKDDELLLNPISWKTNDPRTIWRATEASARSGSPALGVYRRALRVGALQTMSAVRVGTVEGEIVPCAFEHQRIGPQGGQTLLDPGEQEPSPGYPQPAQSLPGMNYYGLPTRR